MGLMGVDIYERSHVWMVLAYYIFLVCVFVFYQVHQLEKTHYRVVVRKIVNNMHKKKCMKNAKPFYQSRFFFLGKKNNK